VGILPADPALKKRRQRRLRHERRGRERDWIIDNSEVVLSVRDLTAEVDGTPILNGVNLEVKAGEIHAIMGQMALVEYVLERCWQGIQPTRLQAAR